MTAAYRVLRDNSYGYEDRDNLISITDAVIPANAETFGYTPRESLNFATGPYGTLGFTYDGVGNRITSVIGSSTDTYAYPSTSNRLGQISLAGGGSRVFTHDATGNVTSEAKPGGTHAFTYDAAGRMSAFRIGGVLQASYTYDAMGRQVIRTLVASGLTIHSVFDSQGRRIAEYNEATGALIREYVWNDWEPVAVIEGGVIYYVRADHIGRPVFATNASGVKIWTASYLPFGSVHVTTGTPIAARFPGQWFQSESGLHQNWMRDYDPTTGRYLQADPLGLVDGASVYGYARQNPGRWTDPTGEETSAATAASASGALFPRIAQACIVFGEAVVSAPVVIAGVIVMATATPVSDGTVQCGESCASRSDCQEQYDNDVAWCFENTKGREFIGCMARAKDNLAICKRGGSRKPRMPEVYRQ